MKKYLKIITNLAMSKSTKKVKLIKTDATEKSLESFDSISTHKNGDFCLKIIAKPNSKESSLVANSQEGLEVKIGSPAVDGQANTELMSFLSKIFNCRKSDLILERGSKNRSKIVTISKETGLSIDKIRELINSNMGK